MNVSNTKLLYQEYFIKYVTFKFTVYDHIHIDCMNIKWYFYYFEEKNLHKSHTMKY